MIQRTPDGYTGTFFFDPDDPLYREHYPGRPVVPGSLIVQAFILAALNHTKSKAYRRVQRFRFKRFVHPGRYVYAMSPTDDGCLVCTLSDGSTPLVTGMLLGHPEAVTGDDHSSAPLRSTTPRDRSCN
jgi:3-hydroxyacyl-[acyl-carrier-protein] dehydratase